MNNELDISLFFGILSKHIRHDIREYRRKQYGRRTVDGVEVIPSTHMDAISYNVPLDQDEEMHIFIPSTYNVEGEVFNDIDADEQKRAAAVLWGEVAKLKPVHGKTKAEIATQEGNTPRAISAKILYGLKKLRDSVEVMECAGAFIPSIYYGGSLRFYKNNQSSIVEYAAIKNEEYDQQQKRRLFMLQDGGIFNGKNVWNLSKTIGISYPCLKNMLEFNPVKYDTAKAVARFTGLQVGELFADAGNAVEQGKRVTFRAKCLYQLKNVANVNESL